MDAPTRLWRELMNHDVRRALVTVHNCVGTGRRTGGRVAAGRQRVRMTIVVVARSCQPRQSSS
ncbi:MAG: hypothetical protein L0I76_35755, partial [Pseudonocardia sp.]|nr:hypothetical protein [Pseudonocardia sp.]